MEATSNKRQATRVIQQNGSAKDAYRRLIVWQKADELAYQIYEATKEFPDDERFGLVSQMRRASVSVPANIVEGYAQATKAQRRRFYGIARSSLAELEYYIDFSYHRLQYLKSEQHETLSALREEVGRLLHGFIRASY